MPSCLQEMEQQLSGLRVEASRKGFGLVTHYGISLQAMGKTDLESMLGDLPLTLCMKHSSACTLWRWTTQCS